MILGCFELLLLLGFFAVLLVLLGRYPAFSAALSWTFRNSRISGWQLLLGAFCLGFLALVISEPASKPGHPLSAVLYPLLFLAALVLFIWAMLRFLSLPIPDAPPANPSPARQDDLSAVRPLLRELGGLLAPVAAWWPVGRTRISCSAHFCRRQR